MKRNILVGLLVLGTAPLFVASAAPKDDVKSAAAKLANADNYSWTTTVSSQGGGRFRMGPVEGKIEKGGFTLVTMTRGDNTIEAVLKGDKGAIKTEDGWKSLAEAAEDDGGGGRNPARFLAMRLRNLKTPAAEAEDMAGKVQDMTTTDDVYSGNLTEEGAKQLLSFRRPGGNGPEISGAKGSAKFWVKDGVLSKCEYHVEGTVSFNGNDRDINRTTTVEIKNVGTTKVSIPDDALKKAS